MDGSLTAAAAVHMMTSVLQGLQMHGQHDANQGALITLGLQIYELLRPKYTEILEVSCKYFYDLIDRSL